MEGSFQPTKLDVDSNIFDKNLHFVSNPEEEELNSLFSSISTSSRKPEIQSLVPEADYPSLLATPSPGLCVKTKTDSKEKFFINLCKLNEIPAPPPITEKELEDMIEKEDYSNLWRVPMSIGAPRKETDKTGGNCWAADVAINKSWFDATMVGSQCFTGFVITVAIEGLGDKHPEEARLDRQNWLILKNKKYLGEKVPQHRIQQRGGAGIQEVGKNAINYEEKSDKNDKKILIKEIDDQGEFLKEQKSVKLSEPKAKEIKKADVVKDKEPKFKIVKEPVEDPKFLVATIEMPGVRSQREMTLDLGEDRLVLEARRVGYSLDIFLPYRLNQEKCGAQFNGVTQELTITMQIVKSGKVRSSI